ncbi:C1 family peptidase [Streptomyces sp. V4-01]|uniref:C1 family peptidase n=1 Tax=Actinacidiphila polyblastidii TaxID=3110430 RepID=A0ABU7P5D2_9ACTN|nr:C1 family peptidase [Streptomyces sp. V4-01]
MPAFRLLPEDPAAPYRMGRHQVHDALVPELEAVVDLLEPIRDVEHYEFQDSFDQRQVGDCTMNAAYGTLVCDPFGKAGISYTQATILDGYRRETRLDDSQIPGHYEPDDTGSTGAWSMRVLEKLGLIKTWHHCRSLHAALRLLNKGPISVGIPWYPSMFTPDADHVIHVDDSVDPSGGHQVCVVANDTKRRRVKIRNSWGLSWGDRGHAWISWDDLDKLLKQGGDVVQPVMA